MKVTASRTQGTKSPVSLKTAASLCRRALRFLGVDPQAELSLAFVSPEEMRALNLRYRGKDSTTDVLSFPMQQFSHGGPYNLPDGETLLGDIVIDPDRALSQAKRYKATPEAEFRRLLVHGMLHLLGYDHETSAADARRMRKEEKRVIAALDADGRKASAGRRG